MENSNSASMSVSPSLLRLLQLTSPALPIGAFAYSQGQEWAVHKGWLTNETEARDWITGLLRHSLAHLDIPILARLYQAWQERNGTAVKYWNAYLFAARESAELQAEDTHLGRALARLLVELDIPEAQEWTRHSGVTFATLFALAAWKWDISKPEACAGYAWAWAENQVAAAIKLIPLGQTMGQRILSQIARVIPDVVAPGLALEDENIGYLSAGLACACALHETQSTRLFRS